MSNHSLRVIFSLFIVLRSFTLHAASFDCEAARTTAERIVCANRRLSELDGLLAGTYKSAIAKAKDPSDLKLQQRAWLRDMRDKCGDTDCLVQVYTARIAMLTGVCDYFSKYNNPGGWRELRKLTVEKHLGEVCFPEHKYCPLESVTLDSLNAMGLASEDGILNELRRNRQVVVKVSLVDIDNDDAEDLRLYRTGRNLRCTSSYFFKKAPDGRFKQVVSKDFEVLRYEGRFCAGDNLLFVRYEDAVYLVEHSNEKSHKVRTVWISSANHLYELCR
jgi:uncharacterized protein